MQWAGEDRHAWQAVGLASCLAALLRWRRYFDDWVTVARTAREAAHWVGDREGEADAWNNLGLALNVAGRTEEAIEAYGKDVEICREFEDCYGTGQTLYNLAIVHEDSGRLADARAQAETLTP